MRRREKMRRRERRRRRTTTIEKRGSVHMRNAKVRFGTRERKLLYPERYERQQREPPERYCSGAIGDAAECVAIVSNVVCTVLARTVMVFGRHLNA